MNTILDAIGAISVANEIRKQVTRDPSSPARSTPQEGVYGSGAVTTGEMFNAKGNVFNGSLTPDMVRGAAEVQRQQQEITDMGALGRALPGAVGLTIAGLADYQLAQSEKANPEVSARNALTAKSRERFSPLGQILAGYGYVEQPGIQTGLLERAVNTALGRDQVIPETALFNARGNIFQQAVFGTGGQSEFGGSTGFETGVGRGDPGSPTDGMESFGGRESAVGGEDRSGYA